MKTRSTLTYSPGTACPALKCADLVVLSPSPGELAAFADPEPDADPLAWHDRALCAEVDPEIFFPADGGSGCHDIKAAKNVCRACPVSAECLSYALAADEEFGVWGGMSERERRRMRQEAT